MPKNPNTWACSFSIAIFAIFCTSCAIPGLSTPQSRCQIIYDDVRDNPNLAGGYSFIAGMGTSELCLYGTLENVNLARLDRDVAGARLNVTVSSSGGPVATWLKVAELLEGRVETLTIDSICMSSCANYLPVIARRVIVPKGALVIWHGAGADRDTLFYRTTELYRRNNVNVNILNDTSRVGDTSVFRDNVKVRQVIGYAITPYYLRSCYGFRNLGFFWHPENLFGINEALHKRSPSSGVFLNPKNIACQLS